MNPVLKEKICFLLNHSQFGTFYRPDGLKAMHPPCVNQPFDRLLFLISGEKYETMSLDSELRTISLKPGDFYFIGKNIWEMCDMSHPLELLCIVPRGSYLRVSFYDLKHGICRGDPWPDAYFHHTTVPCPEALLHTMNALRTIPSEAAADLAKGILRIALSECQRDPGPAFKSLQTFERVRNYLEHSFSEEISRDKTAELFHLSPAYLSQLFTRVAKCSFHEYLVRCRITHAQTLLSNSDFSIKEIAALCGIPCTPHFIRSFRIRTGYSPGKWRILQFQMER